ncbi:Transcription initiation factor IIE subunit alpha [Madurella mycetomatis]|uniref:Transcription initiation factor IIE subunit alpha n=1 Tax=Madurella mycetomatis TaxID=100816 RepID=A0A175W560_9PEZI|nr:Transcription initiation factor IIE subunit alpha [Madurella mycetomatis]
MEVAQTLVRAVMRAFYTTQEILVIEALVTHSVLRDDELAYLMKMNLKDLHKLCATLRDARFLTVHTRPEMQQGKTRPINRTYYYIDYRQTIDAIKWRVYKTDKDMQGIAQPADESKEYFCPQCSAQWTQLEVLDSVSAEGFTCGRCGAVLERSKEREAPGHQQLSRMNNQFKFMTDMLQAVDRVVVPECNFDKALAAARPIVREPTHEVLASIPVEHSGLNKPSAVKGLANVGPKTMQVTISDGDNEQERLEDRKRKERLLKENALPSWITESSVPTISAQTSTQSFEMVDADRDEDLVPAKRVKLETAEPTDDASNAMSFKMEQDDDEDDLEFEDVV